MKILKLAAILIVSCFILSITNSSLAQDTTQKNIEKMRQKENQSKDESNADEVDLPDPYTEENIYESDRTDMDRQGAKKLEFTQLSNGQAPPCAKTCPSASTCMKKKISLDELFSKEPISVVINDSGNKTNFICSKTKETDMISMSFNGEFALHCIIDPGEPNKKELDDKE